MALDINTIKNYELIIKAKQDDKKSIEELLNLYDGLIKKIASYYFYHLKVTHLELDELVTEGQIGFLNAVKRFDVAKGYELSTFATYSIKNSILNALRESSMIKHSTRDIMKQMTKNKELNLEDRTSIFTLDLVDGTENIEICINYSSSTDNTIFDNTVEEQVLNNNDLTVNELLYKAMELLCEKEKLVIINYFGFNGLQKLNLRQISEKYYIPYDKVKILKFNAMRKLKQYLKSRNNNKVQSIRKVM